MKFGLVIFPGSNCEKDCLHVLRSVMGVEVRELWHKETHIDGFQKEDCILLPGGFSYGDYLRTGAIARFSPIMESVSKFAHSGGMVFGICNGFQILCEAGLLPGVLLLNNNRHFICKNIYLKTEHRDSPVTRELPLSKPLKIPIAHADGRYYANKETLDKIESNGQVLFRYCDKDGAVTKSANPNGSLNNIAGICNEQRNVFGMMPHPERASEDILGNSDGRWLFESILNTAKSKV